MASPKPDSRPITPVTPVDDGTISIRSMASSSKGDLRRTSFILTAVQNALNTYGVTSKQIFQGGKIRLNYYGIPYIVNNFMYYYVLYRVDWKENLQ